MRSPLPVLIALALVALGTLACDRRTESFKTAAEDVPPPSTPVLIPDLSQVDPTTIDAPLGGMGSQRPSPASTQGRTAPANAEPGEPDGPPIRGTIRLAEGAREPDQGVLFVIARKAGMRPPLAAVKLPAGPFPMEFEIGPANRAAMGGVVVPFAGAIEISARVDLDNNPMTRGPGELTGSAGEVEPGASGLEVVLSVGG